MNPGAVTWLKPPMRALVGLMTLVLVAGCDVYSRPNRPIPADFKARLLDGTAINRDSFRDKPWVVNVWVPG